MKSRLLALGAILLLIPFVSCDFLTPDDEVDGGTTFTVSGTVTHTGVEGRDLVIAVFEDGADVTAADPIDTATATFSGGTAAYSFPSAEPGTYDVYAIIDMDSSILFDGPEWGDRMAQSLDFVVDSDETADFVESGFSFIDNDGGADYMVGGYVEHSDSTVPVDGKDVIIAVFEQGADTTVDDPFVTYEGSMQGGRSYYSFPDADAGTYDVYAVIDMDSNIDFDGPEAGDRVNPKTDFSVSGNVSDADFTEDGFSTN